LIRTLEKSGGVMILSEVENRLWSSLRQQVAQTSLNTHGDPASGSLVIAAGEPPSPRLQRDAQSYPTLERNEVSAAIKSSFRPFSSDPDNPTFSRLPSTPLRATGYFDADRVTGNPSVYPWAVSMIADSVDSICSSRQKEAPDLRILATTGSGTALACAAKSLLPDPIALDIVDTFGTNQSMYEIYIDPTVPTPPRTDYVYIGNFLIGATELKIAEVRAQQLLSTLTHGIVLGSVLTVDPTRREDIADAIFKRISFHSLFSLTDLAEGQLRYEFP
jgi:hypothetical protein